MFYKLLKLISYGGQPNVRIFFTIVVVPPSKSSEHIIIISKTKRVRDDAMLISDSRYSSQGDKYLVLCL